MKILPYWYFYIEFKANVFSSELRVGTNTDSACSLKASLPVQLLTFSLQAKALSELETSLKAKVWRWGYVYRHVILINQKKLLMRLPRIKIFPEHQKPYTSVVLPDCLAPRHQHCALNLLLGLNFNPQRAAHCFTGEFLDFLTQFVTASQYDLLEDATTGSLDGLDASSHTAAPQAPASTCAARCILPVHYFYKRRSKIYQAFDDARTATGFCQRPTVMIGDLVPLEPHYFGAIELIPHLPSSPCCSNFINAFYLYRPSEQYRLYPFAEIFTHNHHGLTNLGRAPP